MFVSHPQTISMKSSSRGKNKETDGKHIEVSKNKKRYILI